MSSRSTKHPDLPRIFAPKRQVDSRGWFCESFNEGRMRDAGITCRFVQDNQSNSSGAGTLRGLHFQLPPAAQAKLVAVLRGRILDVAVDVRRGSPTYGRYVSTELSDDRRTAVLHSEGFAHGFLTLTDNVLVMYKVSDYYAPALEDGVRWDDPDIAFPWSVRAADLLLSDKDRQLPFLREFNSPFAYDGHPLVPPAPEVE